MSVAVKPFLADTCVFVDSRRITSDGADIDHSVPEFHERASDEALDGYTGAEANPGTF